MKLLSLLLLALPLAASAANDNIVIRQREVTYTITEENGVPATVKRIENTTYEAVKKDGNLFASTWYGGHVKINKASAPGAKPKYRKYESDEVFHDDTRICYMIVPVTKGKPANVKFESTYTDPAHFCEILLITSYDADLLDVTVKVPASLADRLQFNPVDTPEDMTFTRTSDKKGNLTYNYRLENLKGFDNEPMAPESGISAPRIRISGYFPDLDSLYAHFHALVPEDESSDRLIMETADKACEGCSDDYARADAITRWVRDNVRYVAIEHGEYGSRPETASNVLRNLYGDCKGSANLIRNMLRAKGIDARLVWIGTNGKIDTDWTEYPTLASGNHMIAAAIIGDSIIYLDGTAEHCPPHYYSPGIAGRQALIEGKNGSFVTARVPVPSPMEDTDSIHLTLSIDGTSLKGHARDFMSGVHAIAFTQACSGLTDAKRADYSTLKLTYPFRNCSVSDIRTDHSLGNPVILSGDVSIPSAVNARDSSMIVDIKPIKDIFTSPVKVSGRRRPVEIPFGYRLVSVTELQFPEGCEVTLPENFAIANQWFDASISYSRSDNKATCHTELKMKRGIIPLDLLPEWDKDLRRLIAKASSRIKILKIQSSESE